MRVRGVAELKYRVEWRGLRPATLPHHGRAVFRIRRLNAAAYTPAAKSEGKRKPNRRRTLLLRACCKTISFGHSPAPRLVPAASSARPCDPERTQSPQRNHGAPGIDRMSTVQLETTSASKTGRFLKDKLLREHTSHSCETGRDTQAEGRNQDVRHPNGTGSVHSAVALQVLTPIFDPRFSKHSYGFRPGAQRTTGSASRATICAERKGLGGGIDITKFFDHVNHDILLGRVAVVIRDKRVLG